MSQAEAIRCLEALSKYMRVRNESPIAAMDLLLIKNVLLRLGENNKILATDYLRVTDELKGKHKTLVSLVGVTKSLIDFIKVLNMMGDEWLEENFPSIIFAQEIIDRLEKELIDVPKNAPE